MPTNMVVQIAALATGILVMLFGAISAYVSYLCIKGKIKPNPYVGVRLNVSRNYRCTGRISTGIQSTVTAEKKYFQYRSCGHCWA